MGYEDNINIYFRETACEYGGRTEAILGHIQRELWY
jgi:hypothetical protein